MAKTNPQEVKESFGELALCVCGKPPRAMGYFVPKDKKPYSVWCSNLACFPQRCATGKTPNEAGEAWNELIKEEQNTRGKKAG